MLIGITFVAAAVQGALGFGFGMTSMALLSLSWPVREAVPVVQMLALALNIGLSWRYRDTSLPRSAGWMLLGGLIGVPLGVVFLVGAPPRALLLGLAAILLGYVALRLWSPTVSMRPPSWTGGFAGFFGGVLGAAFNAGGPPVVLYVSTRDDWSPVVVKRVLTSFFLVLGLFGVLSMIQAGVLGSQEAARGVGAVPFAIGGGWAGHALSRRMSEERFRSIVLVALAGLGLVFLSRGIGL